MRLRKSLTGLLVVAMLLAGVMSAAAQQGQPPLGQNEGALVAALEAASNETGLTSAVIMQQLSAGASLAEIIVAEGGDVQVVIDAAVDAMAESVDDAVASGLLTELRADRMRANLEAAVTDAVNGEWPGRGFGGGAVQRGARAGRGQGRGPAPGEGFGGSPGFGRGNNRGGPGLGWTGSALGTMFGRGPLFLGGLLDDASLDAQALHGALQAGSTVSEAITAAGGDPQAAMTAAVAGARERLTAAVDAGWMTQEQADAALSGMEAHLGLMLETSPLVRLDARHFGFGSLWLAADETGLTLAELRQTLADGATLRDVLVEHDVDVAAFVDELVASAEARLASLTDDGLTQARVDELLASARAAIEACIGATGNANGVFDV